MSSDAGAPPKYNPDVVAQVILEEAVELHPQYLQPNDLIMRIVADISDTKEVRTADLAIRDLRDTGLFQVSESGGFIEPTRAALRAVALLT